MDMSRVSTCSIALIDHNPEKAMEIIAEAGYKKVDVLEKLPHLSLFPNEFDPKILNTSAKVHGLKIANLATYVGGGQDGRRTAWKFHGWNVPNPERFTSYGFSSKDSNEIESETKQLYRAIDLATYFGARSIRVVAGNDDPRTLDRLVPCFKRATEYAEEKKIYMGLENHSSGIAGTPKLCVELAKNVGSPYFGVLYEPGNLMYDTGTDYREALNTMKEHVVHCHFKDCAPEGEGHEMKMMGHGRIDFKWIVEQLENVGYDGDFALEYELHSEPPEIGLKKFYNNFEAIFL